MCPQIPLCFCICLFSWVVITRLSPKLFCFVTPLPSIIFSIFFTSPENSIFNGWFKGNLLRIIVHVLISTPNCKEYITLNEQIPIFQLGFICTLYFFFFFWVDGIVSTAGSNAVHPLCLGKIRTLGCFWVYSLCVRAQTRALKMPFVMSVCISYRVRSSGGDKVGWQESTPGLLLWGVMGCQRGFVNWKPFSSIS